MAQQQQELLQLSQANWETLESSSVKKQWPVKTERKEGGKKSNPNKNADFI